MAPAGDLLIDGRLTETASPIEADIGTLGFLLKNGRTLMNSHAHLDHAGGLAELKKPT